MTSSVVSASLRCPFPGCAQQRESLTGLTEGVFLCGKCHRLSALCGAGDCTALNRPFSRFCRRCQRDLFSRSRGPTATQRWRAAAQFACHWRLASAQLASPAVVADFDHTAGYRPFQVLLQCAMVEGFLAIHQGGGFIAVTHPFGETEQGAVAPRLLWSRPEEHYLTLPDIPYEAETFRPFPPTPTADRRYVLFSTPYAVLVLDACSLPGWTVEDRVDCRLLWACRDPQARRLAAAPIPLSQAPYRAGLLLYDQGEKRYLWTVRDLAAAPASGASASEPELHPLPLCGEPCQYHWVGEQALAFSTPEEHWVWRTADACEANVEAMRRTWPRAPRCGQVVLDRHVEQRQYFSWARQHIYLPRRWQTGRETLGRFEWCYQYVDDETGQRQFQSYLVSLSDLETTFPTGPTQFAGALPLGQRWLFHEGGDDLAEMWFLGAERDGRLYRRTPEVKDLSPTQILTVDRTEIDGLRLDDPLLTIVAHDASEAGQRISLYTLQDPRVPAIIDGLRLAADPLVWSRWLFTCEREGRHVRVLRRCIEVETPGHPSPTHPPSS